MLFFEYGRKFFGTWRVEYRNWPQMRLDRQPCCPRIVKSLYWESMSSFYKIVRTHKSYSVPRRSMPPGCGICSDNRSKAHRSTFLKLKVGHVQLEINWMQIKKLNSSWPVIFEYVFDNCWGLTFAVFQNFDWTIEPSPKGEPAVGRIHLERVNSHQSSKLGRIKVRSLHACNLLKLTQETRVESLNSIIICSDWKEVSFILDIIFAQNSFLLYLI